MKPQPQPGVRTHGGVFTDSAELAGYMAYHRELNFWNLAAHIRALEPTQGQRFMDRWSKPQLPKDGRMQDNPKCKSPEFVEKLREAMELQWLEENYGTGDDER